MTNPQPEPMAKLSLEDKILHFNAYFQETVPEGPETNHIRKVSGMHRITRQRETTHHFQEVLVASTNPF